MYFLHVSMLVAEFHPVRRFISHPFRTRKDGAAPQIYKREHMPNGEKLRLEIGDDVEVGT